MQSISTKRAQVELHGFASLGEPERAIATYEEVNHRRRGLMLKYRDFIGPMSPFLEIGANAGHTSYMVANTFGADGFALDLSADALRYGAMLRERWGMTRSPVRVAGDGANLPFRDGSLRMVMAFQTVTQFPDIERLIQEVHRVLAPGGLFFFGEEPLRRLLSLRLYYCPYPETMKPWERKLHEWGLLGYLIRDVVGSQQEEICGIRQNYSLDLPQWRTLLNKHFADCKLEVFVHERGWGERIVKRLAVRLDPYRSQWRAARLLGGTLAAFCRKAGEPPQEEPPFSDSFERYLRCPACQGSLERDAENALRCACGYESRPDDGVYMLLPPSEQAELYPAEDRPDTIDFSRPGHEKRLIEGWEGLEGVFGARYRWIGRKAVCYLTRTRSGPMRLRIRGYAPERIFGQRGGVHLEATVQWKRIGRWKLTRPGLFVLEAPLPEGTGYRIEIKASPVWQAPGDVRPLSVNISLVRMVPAGPGRPA